MTSGGKADVCGCIADTLATGVPWQVPDSLSYVNGFVAAAIEVLDGSAVAEDVSPRPQDQAGRPQLEAATEPVAYSTKVSNLGSGRSRRWKLEGPLPLGTFDEHSREAEESWKWGDEFVERYGPFIRFSGRDGFAPAMLALGFDLTHVSPNGEVVGFHLGSGGGSKRAITQFFRSDNFAETNELLSMIRGGGPRGRSGFRAHDPLPGPTTASRLRSWATASRASGTSRPWLWTRTTTRRCFATRSCRACCADSSEATRLSVDSVARSSRARAAPTNRR